jgi:ELWxxDGT repeat protein
MSAPRLVKDINPGSASASPIELTAVGNTLYFAADDGKNGFQLWRSNGTAASTKPVTTGRKFVASPANLTALGNTLFFSADDGFSGDELWKSNGTVAGTVRVADILPGSTGSQPLELTAFDGQLFFSALIGSSRRELWRHNPSSLSTLRLTSYDVIELAPSAASLYFTRDSQVWKTDGTLPETEQVSNVSRFQFLSPRDYTPLNNAVFYTASNASTNSTREIWRTDGTSVGTVQVSNLIATSPPIGGFIQTADPRDLTTTGDTLYFTASDNANGRELWRTNGTTASTVRVADIRPGSSSSDPRFLTPVGSTLYFVAFDDVFGNELWKTDGTTAGTVRVRDIAQGSFSSAPEELIAVGNMLYFTADDGTSGRELWRTDGTAAGTERVADIRSGLFSSNPANLTTVGQNLYFTADNGSNGRELYILDLTPPVINAISLEGNRLLLSFSKDIVTTGLQTSRFSITVSGSSRAVSAIKNGPSQNQLLLTIAGASPSSDQTVRLRYIDLSPADDPRDVIQDADGNDMETMASPGRVVDTYRSTSTVASLASTTTNLVLTGNWTINGTGNALANTITGNANNNILNGGAGNDTIIGVAGNDTLNGGLGNDILTGGLGRDIFLFNTPLNSRTNRDRITDFNRSQGDRIQLENAIFRGIGGNGTLSASRFHSGSRFTAPSQRILYNPTSGNLTYDSNGSLRGGRIDIFATLTNRPTLNSTFFAVI